MQDNICQSALGICVTVPILFTSKVVTELSLYSGFHLVYVLSQLLRNLIGPGSVLRGPSRNATVDAVKPKLNCDSPGCPFELPHPPEDCNVNSSLSFTLQICRVEDILVKGLIEGSVVHFHRARTVNVQPFGIISTSGMGLFLISFNLYSMLPLYIACYFLRFIPLAVICDEGIIISKQQQKID